MLYNSSESRSKRIVTQNHNEIKWDHGVFYNVSASPNIDYPTIIMEENVMMNVFFITYVKENRSEYGLPHNLMCKQRVVKWRGKILLKWSNEQV